MGRSRLTPEREAELYDAVLDLLREVGYDALTMDAVASRTRSSKATLYRQWQGKPELVARALRHGKPVSIEDIDTGSVRGDFAELVSRADDQQMERDSALMRGLAQAIHNNPDLHRALREVLFDPEMNGLDAILRRGIARGEIASDCPALRFVPHMLIGAFVARQLLEDRCIDAAFLSAYLDAVVLPALGV
ncbi:TetR/AcrR family transcriptional regulator [Streptomyces inhibens]|uniref:TetR/AcrR family transcriptional regulator n=1 Tax=Streptomyces inhibens TaxID=2293571 RepID=A0A371Q584_STRIH|nr:TetR/AcrR family transcriptional regulator [Streptomyces inhibens]REK89885.1 TetR/AcrR family transcriptional regulator [Streptomyces inhibens]